MSTGTRTTLNDLMFGANLSGKWVELLFFRGWVRRVSDGEVFLVGDVNRLGGVCDVCVGLDKDDEIEIIAELEVPE